MTHTCKSPNSIVVVHVPFLSSGYAPRMVEIVWRRYLIEICEVRLTGSRAWTAIIGQQSRRD
jgi:hypothetical protein